MNLPLPKPGKRPKCAISRRHSKACREYKENFLVRYNYPFCERCGETNPLVFDTHHIISAGSAPQHLYLHDHRNLILLCRNCHNAVEQNPDENRKLVLKRSLWELFDTPLTRAAKAEAEGRDEES